MGSGHSSPGLRLSRGRTLRSDSGALIQGREPTRLPVQYVVDGKPFRVIEHDVSGQVFVLAAQCIRDPGPQGRTARQHASRLHDEDARLMVEVGGKHGPDQGDVIDLPGQMRHNLGNLDSGFPVLGEAKRRRHQSPGLVGELDIVGQIPAGRPATVLFQHGLRIKQINLAGTTIHEQMDYGLCLRLEVGCSRIQVIDLAPGAGQDRVGRKQISPQEEATAVPQRPSLMREKKLRRERFPNLPTSW